MRPKILCRLALALALATLSARGAVAGDKPAPIVIGRMTAGYSYYNRPGADQATHDEAVAACVEEGMRLKFKGEGLRVDPDLSPQYQTSLDGVAAMAIASALFSGVASSGHIGVVTAGIENCMVVRGWRVALLPEAEGRRLAKLQPDQLAGQLAPWIGADTPPGRIARAWNNDAADGRNQRLAGWPLQSGSIQLSVVAATARTSRTFKVGSGYGAMTFGGRPDLLQPAQISAAPGDAGVIVIGIRGVGGSRGPGVTLEAASQDGDRTFGFTRIGLGGGKGSDFSAFAVSPGRWRLAAIGPLNFCLGSPAFDVKAGEVVYAGTFDLSAVALGPDLSLDKVDRWLAGAAVARPASYINGLQSPCYGSAIYALEVPGAPFLDGYAWGGRAGGEGARP